MAAVSVALCTRNGARFLPAQVQSICTQDLLPREIVLSDDGSSDDSVALVRQTMAACGVASSVALTVFENRTPLGVTRNFEQAVRACRHELIALSDHDDVWHPGRLARMAGIFGERPELLLLHTDARLVDEELRSLGSTLFQALEVQPGELEAIARGDAFEVLLRRNLVTGATTMFRRTLLTAALPFSEEWVHDEWLGALAAATGRMDVLPEPLIDYRQHGRNQIGAKRPTLADKLRKAMDTRGDKHRQRLRRAQALLERLQSLPGPVPEVWLQAQREKVAHQRFRAELPASRLARLLPVLREAARGRYDRYGRGKQAIAQDLLERG
ncbi:glycosyltransferase [Variovorax sp. JS1663]|uniref:glycosyltransferase n=1 Tax=Variovorax sp. JS1663 TaxID=1851577 RepID=UPI000B656EDD|nr:glycosyltransferase [Variovorax sp. JS1663]OUM02040.1 glycosyl transferase family 2 [Variovorax sp. JS1663]